MKLKAFMNILSIFKTHLLSQGDKISLVTVKNYISDINQFINWYEQTYRREFLAPEVSKEIITAFARENRNIYSDSSLNRHISSLRKFFAFLYQKDLISLNPFLDSSHENKINDRWYFHEFKNYLYVSGISRLTITNYLIDIQQFIQWYNNLSQNESVKINNSVYEKYRSSLRIDKAFSDSSINRKISSLRKYLSWARENKYFDYEKSEATVRTYNHQENLMNKEELLLYDNSDFNFTSQKSEKIGYSRIPPIRLYQKVSKFLFIIAEYAFIIPLSYITVILEKALWRLTGRKIFSQVRKVGFHRFSILKISGKDLIDHFNNLKHLLKTRGANSPNYPFLQYFNIMVGLILLGSLVFGFYNNFIKSASKKPILASLSQSPPRILSFQGRLTDNTDTPINKNKNLRFAIYNDSIASGSALLWQEIDTVSPDNDGIFSTYLGNNEKIPQSLFSQNANLYIGVSVEQSKELLPREQIATVPFAANTETLQGMKPITQPGAGNTNVILALDSSGNLSISGQQTTFQSISGEFKLQGQSTILATNPGSNGNIQLSPDGAGIIDIQKPIKNTTTGNNNLIGADGSVEVDDTFSILANSDNQSAFVLDQKGSGDLISASSSGVSKFTVANDGTITTGGQALTTNQDTFNLLNSSATTINFAGAATALKIGATTGTTTINNNLSLNGNITLGSSATKTITTNAQFNTSLVPATSASYDLGSNSKIWNSLYANNFVTATTSGQVGLLQISNSIVSPYVSSYKFSVGTSNSLGTLDIRNITNTQATATISGSTSDFGLIVDNSGTGDIFNAASQGLSRLIVKQNGNVGIGTTSPASTLDVAGNITTSGNIAVNGGSITTSQTSANVFNTNTTTLAIGGASTSISLGAGTGTTTVNNNLEVNGGSITTTQTSANLFNTTATNLNIGGAATTLSLGAATGTTTINNNLGVNGGSLTTNQTIGNIFNTTATTLNIGGAATTVSIGSGTGTTTINNNINVAGTTTFNTQTYSWPSAGQSNGYFLSTDGSGNLSWRLPLNYWQLNAGVLSPQSLSNDLAIGGSATSSASFQIFSSTGNATTSGNLTFNSAGSIQTTKNQTLTLGGDTTGNIILNPKNGAGNITFSGYGAGVIHSNSSGLLSSSALNLNSSDVADTLQTGNGGTGQSSFSIGDMLYYASGTNLSKLSIGASNTILTSTGTQPQWSTSLNLAGGLTAGGTITANGGLTLSPGQNLTLSGFTSGSVPYINSTNQLSQDNSNFFWDASNKRLGLGGNTNLQATLDVRSNSGILPAASISANTISSAMVIDNSGSGDLFTASSSGLSRFTISNNGNVNIGVATTSAARLTVTGGQTQLEISTQYSERLCHSGSDGSVIQQVLLGDCSAGGADYAEDYGSSDASIEAGDIVIATNGASMVGQDSKAYVAKSYQPYQGAIIGIVSTHPNDVIGKNFTNLEHHFPIALSGRVPVKVASSSDAIHAGDFLTSSSDSGKAMKATTAGMTIGKALEDWSPDSGKSTILVFTNITWHDPDITFGSNGDMYSHGNPIANYSKDTKQSIEQIIINALANIGTIPQLLTDSIKSTRVISPVADINHLKTDIISPLSTDSDIAITFQKNKMAINNKDLNGNEVASIDNQGNAFFKGHALISQDTNIGGNLFVRHDATVSGTLHVNKLIADEIDIPISSPSAQYITNITNIYNSTPSASITPASIARNGDNTATPSALAQNITDGLQDLSKYVDIASYSGYLSFVPALDSMPKEAKQPNLVTSGTSNFEDVGLSGTLSIGSQMLLANNTINVLNGDLELQPLRQGGVSIAGGQVYFDSSGNLTLNGNATFNGNLAAKIISPIANHDLTFNLNNTQTNNMLPNLSVKNASGSGVFILNQIGDIIASGAATFSKLNLDIAKPALAVSETEVVATSSAGTTNIARYQTEVTINNPLVTEKSLIYITPVGNDSGQTPYLLRQVANKSFTVGIAHPSTTSTEFNWLLIN